MPFAYSVRTGMPLNLMGIFSFMKEIFKPIIGYEGFYEISNFGNVRSLSHYHKTCGGGLALKKERILAKFAETYGYIQVTLCKGGIGKVHKVHRLVAKHFVSNPDNKPQVNHIDCDKENNRVDNLEWVTPKENIVHAHINNLMKSRKGIPREFMRKRIIQFNLSGEMIKEFASISLAATETGICTGNICQCAKGKRLRTKSYKWKYA